MPADKMCIRDRLWSLWRNDERIVGDLDLYRFFAKKPMDMDRNIEQEFEILVTVYADKIIVTEVTESDWDEGGAIGLSLIHISPQISMVN